jgi:hypothetical protein
MRCGVCGQSRFVSTEYKVGSKRAPALECARCHAISLEEGLARTDGERESVRLAIALRQAIQEAWSVADESGVFEVGSPVRQEDDESIGRRKAGS